MVIQITEDLLLDLEGIYESLGEEAADLVRDALAAAVRTLGSTDFNRSMIEPYGKTGTTFAFRFISGYIVTFSIRTHFDQNSPTEEHYFLKNIFRKQ